MTEKEIEFRRMMFWPDIIFATLVSILIICTVIAYTFEPACLLWLIN